MYIHKYMAKNLSMCHISYDSDMNLKSWGCRIYWCFSDLPTKSIRHVSTTEGCYSSRTKENEIHKSIGNRSVEVCDMLAQEVFDVLLKREFQRTELTMSFWMIDLGLLKDQLTSPGKLMTAELYPTNRQEPKHVVKMASIKFNVIPC